MMEKKNKKHVMKKSTLLKKTYPYIKKYKGWFFLTLFLCIITALLSASTPFITRAILDDYLPNRNFKMVSFAILAYAIIAVILLFSRYFFAFVNTLTGMKIEKSIREEAMYKINKLQVDYFNLEPDGKIVSKITSDSTGVRNFYTKTFDIFNALINIVVVYAAIIILNPMLGLITLGIVPIIILWVTIYRKWVHKYFVDLRETGSRITGKLNENITGTLIIQDFNQEENILNEYKDLTKRYIKNERKTVRINNFFGFELLAFLKRILEITLLMYLGFTSIEVGGEILGIGLIAALVENLDKMINPFNTIFNNLNELEDSMVAATRVYDLLDEPNDSRIDTGSIAPRIEGEVEFKHIFFAYVNDNYVLKDFSLKVEAGKTIGIVGATGSGKSSLMNLLLGYNDYQKGEILIDNVPVTEYNKSSLRENMGIVLQTPALFMGTLKSNVTFERDYSDDDVKKVIEAVGASYMLDKYKEGINMPISFRGENLSLGEKQLIAFARILLRNPKVLVLDEATANIDSETEMKIKAAMDVIAKGRTTFIIAHRLSTIQNADEIIVLDQGKLVGKGKHDYLYKTCVQYQKMYDSQS